MDSGLPGISTIKITSSTISIRIELTELVSGLVRQGSRVILQGWYREEKEEEEERKKKKIVVSKLPIISGTVL